MIDLREIQRKQPKLTVTDAQSILFAKDIQLRASIGVGLSPDPAMADLILATLALADALGIDVESLLNHRTVARGALLSK